MDGYESFLSSQILPNFKILHLADLAIFILPSRIYISPHNYNCTNKWETINF